MKYLEILKSIGLSQNEAKIYEAMLYLGECSVKDISDKTLVHRRNVYDSIKRLEEKALVFEIAEKGENRYQAVEPRKLREIVVEKLKLVDSILPELEKMHFSNPAEFRVHTYRGQEGWKQYMRDIIKVNEPFYSIAAQGAWMDERVKLFFPSFLEQAKKKKIEMHHLFDYEVKENNHSILKHVGKKYKFLPKKYSTTSGIDIFGDRVNIMHQQNLGKVGTVDEISFIVIINQNLADSFKTWFKLMWDLLS